MKSAIGTDRFGAARNRQIVLWKCAASGVATRPGLRACFPTQKITDCRTIAGGFHSTGWTKHRNYREVTNGGLGAVLVT